MPSYTPPLRDLSFVLHETLRIQDRGEIEGYAELTDDLSTAILGEAGKLAAELVAGAPSCVDPAPFRFERFQEGERPELVDV